MLPFLTLIVQVACKANYSPAELEKVKVNCTTAIGSAKTLVGVARNIPAPVATTESMRGKS
jgi:hypothetical protein